MFFEKFAARRALLLGAELATTLGDSTLATLYSTTAPQVETDISSVNW